ncbi:hypothetical protein PGT21_006568 [Puccinia graminis f. sp. tritici]|uniref:Uncharacterized protein n=1 Tax=Puccinia graminis f. sp. tritici TaxID=56615 RepID=A0A5B0LY34_PUCGR|nr:hypothetical protein PGT21_006568 [Puccinia graminis f. sp. tritici]
MTIDPLQSISDSLNQSSHSHDPDPSTSNTSSKQNPNPPIFPTNTSTPVPKQPPNTIPQAPSKSNPTQKGTEARSQSHLNPNRKDNGSTPKGSATAPKSKTATILNTENGKSPSGSQKTPEAKALDPDFLKSKARNMLLAKAIKAQEDGDDEKADRFFAMHNTLLKEETLVVSQSDQEIQILTNQPTIPQKRPLAAEETVESKGIKFRWGVSNSHDDGGFTPYFHKNISELKGPIPLTIFNKKWQEEALSYHSRNRPKEETSTGKGL